jgi:hypothetical protein
VDGAKARDAESDERARREGRAGDDEGEPDHGENRYPTPHTVSRCRGRAGSSSIFDRRRRMWTVTVPVSNAAW